MTTEQLNVQITANASSLKNELSDSEKAVQHLRSALGKIKTAVEDPERALQSLKTILDHFKHINTQITLHMDPKWEYMREYVDEIRGTIAELQDSVDLKAPELLEVDSLPIADAVREYDEQVQQLGDDLSELPAPDGGA